ncbi:MAG: hypothetical protein R3F30_05580 [Planctomycetota bacterium]
MRIPVLLLCTLPALAARAPAQDGGEPESRPATRPAVEEPADWPKLQYAKKEAALGYIAKLASAKQDVADKARDALAAYGPGVCPVLLAAYHERAKPGTLEALRGLLDELATKEWGPVLEREHNDKNVLLTRYIVARLDGFHDARYADYFRKVAALGDEEASLTASYALAAIGDAAALDFLIERARKDWNGEKARILAALPALKSDEVTDRLCGFLEARTTAEKLVGLRLLNAAGTKKATSKVAGFLNDESNILRVEAVNALRGIVDGKAPYDQLPVFKSIEVVKEWKRRLGA